LSASPSPSPLAAWSLVAIVAALSMVGPFSIDAYLPAFPMIAADLGATPLQMQQTLSAYLFAYAAMMLWHGALSDALGRRPVLLVGLAVYAFASLGCAMAGNIETLWLFRVLQGVSAGAGMVVGRAIIRDCFQGADAQRQMSRVTMMFSLAPALAPVIGGLLATSLGWRSVFHFLLMLTLALLAWTAFGLPETLPPAQRQSLAARRLLANYGAVFAHREFRLLALVPALNFIGFFVYIAAAPAFLIGHLGLDSRQFGWLFIPMIAGVVLGAYTSGRVAGRLPTSRTVGIGYAIMFAGAMLNLAIVALATPGVPWSVLPVMVYTFGSSLVMPSVTLLLLDLFPRMRGTVSSVQSFVQLLLAAVVSGAIAPFLAQSLAWLALSMLVCSLLGYALWQLYRRRSSPRSGSA
jgi:DHA1 family bicyclomycin/chloramphenicol resistance-like MFS transporter